jgi:Tfp pilus assembly protein FimT
LITVLVVLGILGIVSVAKLRPALEHAKVNSAASVLASDLQYAQLLAARQRKPVVVIVTSATRQYIIRDRPVGGTIFRTRYLGQDTDYSLDSLTTTAPSSRLEIFPTGVTVASSTFRLVLRGFSRTVRFSRAGQIKVL